MQPKVIIILILAFFSASCQNTSPKSFALDFLDSPHWDQGKAEVQIYKAKIKRYGITRKAQTSLILVKEPFDSKKMVKSNQNRDFDVLKMNYIVKIPTGIYQYYQMASCFFRVPDGKLIKYSQASEDGCGISFRRFTINNNTLETFSYFDDQGHFTDKIKKQGLVFYDALPFYLRFYLKNSNQKTIKILPGFLSNQYIKPESIEATFQVNLFEEKIIDNQNFKNIYLVKLSYQGKEEILLFRKDHPHTMLLWQKANGDSLVLAKSYFTAYWEKTKPEHDKMLQTGEE